MDKFNFVQKDGMIKLPPGFRFQPTDEELVFQYLKRKVLSWPLPASIIPEVNVSKYDPWDFPGDLEQERYFFSKKEAKYPNGNRFNRSTASGRWKATGLDKKIISSSKNNNNVVGMKKTLVFYRGKPPHGSRTDWIMHEYRLVSVGNPEGCNFVQAKNLPDQTSSCQLEKWVLCRIFLRKKSVTNTDNDVVETCKHNQVNNVVMNQPRFFDFMTRDKIIFDPVSCSSSSSSSSSITEVRPTREDYEESNSRSIF